MTDYPTSGIKLVAETADYTTAMTDALNLADQMDGYGTITLTVSAEVDTSSFNISDLPADNEQIDITVDATLGGDEIPTENEKIDIDVDATLGGDELPKDDERIGIDVDTTLGGDELPVQGDTTDVTVDVTQSGDTLPVDGDTTSATVNTTIAGADDNSKGIFDTLKAIKNNQTFKMVVNMGGTALDFISAVGKFSAGPLVEMDTALAKIKATTGEVLPGARELVSKLFYSDLGESISQIGDLVAQAHQLGAPLDEATESTLKFTKAFSDQNPKEVMTTLSNMVKEHLAPDYASAADMLTVAFQKNANRSGDFLSAINNNAAALHDMGLTGEEAFTRIISGLDGGAFKGATDVVNVLLKAKQAFVGASGHDTAATRAIDTLGIPNPADSGKAWTNDFITGVITAINNYKGTETEKEALFSAIFGGKVGTRDYSAFMSLGDADAATIFAPVKGAAATAAGDMRDSLGGAIADFERQAQLAAVDFMSSKSIDLPGKISKLKEGLQDGLKVLQDNGSLSDALTIALKPIGFDDEFQGLESALGNFVIGILQAVAAVQDLQHDTAGAAGTRSTIGKMAETQLAYDLKIANPDQIASDVSTAVSRGVSTQDVMKAAGTAVDELIKNGSIERAKILVENLRTQADTGVQLKINPNLNTDDKAKVAAQLQAFGFGTLNSDGSISMNISPGMSADAIAGWSKTIVDTLTEDFGNVGTQQGVLSVPVEPVLNDNVVAVLQSKIDKHIDDVQAQKLADIKDASLTGAGIVNTASDDVKTQATAATVPITAAATQITAVGNQSKTAAPQVQSISDATKKAGDSARNAAPPIGDVSGQLDAMSINAPLAATGLSGLNIAIGNIIKTANSLDNANAEMTAAQKAASGNTAADPGKHAAGGSFIGTGIVGDAGPEVVSSDTGLSVLNNATTERLMAALMGYIPGGSFGGKGNVSNTIINQNNIPNIATADALGYKQAETLRGMSGG